MPSSVTLIRSCNPATSYRTRNNDHNSNNYNSKKRVAMQSNFETAQSGEIESLLLRIQDDALQRFLRDVIIPSNKAHVIFKIEQYTEIITHLQQKKPVKNVIPLELLS